MRMRCVSSLCFGPSPLPNATSSRPFSQFFNLSASFDPETGHEFYDYTEGSDIHAAYNSFIETNVKSFMVR